MNQNDPRLKRDRPIRSNDVAPHKRTTISNRSKWPMPTLLLKLEPAALIDERTLEVVQTHEKINDFGNTKILTNYCNDLLDGNYIIIDDMFAFLIAHEIMHNYYKSRFITKCRQRQD